MHGNMNVKLLELQFLPQNKHIISFTTTNQLMRYREIIPTTSECRKETQLHCVGKVQFLNSIARSICNKYWALKILYMQDASSFCRARMQ
jgi:hypothetical protein